MKKQKAMGDPRSIRVLLYHRILKENSETDWANIGVSEAAFRKQIELLDAWKYTTITFADYALFCNGDLDLPPKPIIITFDDAYKEIYDFVFPILKQFGMKAIIFVVADKAITTSEWDKGAGQVFDLLNQVQILDLQSAGLEIGSHTLTHPKLTLIPESKVREELTRSRIALEILLNAPVHSFAYPYGSLNADIKRITKEAGYTAACASFSGSPFFGSDHFEIRRIKVLNTTNSFLFWFQLQSLYLLYRWVRWQVKKLLLWYMQRGKKSKYDFGAIDQPVQINGNLKNQESLSVTNK